MIFQFLRDSCGETPAAYETFERCVLAVGDLRVGQAKQELLMLTVKTLLDRFILSF